MSVVTTRRAPAGPKPFSWSYSRLKNFETCPKRHWHVDINKDAKEEDSEQLQWGNAVHKALADRIANGTPLPIGMERYEDWANRILTGGGNILVEQKLAINKDFGKTTWFGDEAWYRGIGDVIKIVGRVGLIVDWKTGKIIEDSQQLALMAACVFAHFPEVLKVRSVFAWLKEDADTKQDFDRNQMVDMWRNLWPRIEALRNAHTTTSYPAKPGRLCRNWCPVKQCPHNGESYG